MVALLEGEGLAALCAGVRRLPCVHGCYGEHLNGICLNRYLCIFHLQVICVPKPKGATIYQNYAMHVSSIGQRERNKNNRKLLSHHKYSFYACFTRYVANIYIKKMCASWIHFMTVFPSHVMFLPCQDILVCTQGSLAFNLSVMLEVYREHATVIANQCYV